MQTITYPLNEKKYIHTETVKRYVCWHGSFGRTVFTPFGSTPVRATSTIDNWNNSEDKYGSPYLVDRNGDIYSTFDDREWIYHLGLPTTKGFYDKQSVAITLANELYIGNGQPRCAFGINSNTNRYSGPVFEKEWRGYKYWARMNPEQVDAAIALTLDVCNKHNINPVFNVTDEWNPKVWDTATIFTHAATKREALDFTLEPWVIDKIQTAGIKVVDS